MEVSKHKFSFIINLFISNIVTKDDDRNYFHATSHSFCGNSACDRL